MTNGIANLGTNLTPGSNGNGQKKAEEKESGKFQKVMHKFNLFLHPAVKRQDLWETALSQFKAAPPKDKDGVDAFLDAMNTRVKHLNGKGEAQAALNLLRKVAEEAKELGQSVIAAEALVAVAKNSRRVQVNGNGKMKVANIKLYVEALELVADSGYPKASEWVESLVRENERFNSVFEQKQDEVHRANDKLGRMEKSVIIAELLGDYNSVMAVRFCVRAENYLSEWYALEKRGIADNVKKNGSTERSESTQRVNLDCAEQKQSKNLAKLKEKLALKGVNLSLRIQKLIERFEKTEPAAASPAQSPEKENIYGDGNGKSFIDPNDLHTVVLGVEARQEAAQITANNQQ